MSLRVYSVLLQESNGHHPPPLPDGVRTITVRELGAVVEEGDYSAREVGPQDVARHLEVNGALFSGESVLPTPVGTVFRSAEVLQRWMELHYVALSDALAWIEGRSAARVHITRAAGRPDEKEAGSDLAGLAAEVTRSLRRHAVASVPLRNEEITGIVLSAAYLVERGLFREFADAVAACRARHDNVRIELTGPWPPYDFVRMQFGA
jgi:gas vesicle protein GvpL/GvpF